MKLRRRDKFKIYGDILTVLTDQTKTEKIVLTRLQTQVNVPYDRLKNYISDLKELDLIEDETSFNLTKKGKQYVKGYARILEFMEHMGLTYR